MTTSFSPLAKTRSGPIQQWEEADSLLPETPIRRPMELTAYPVGDGRRARHALYASHFLSMWGQRAWEFAVGLVMLEIRQSSLLLVSLFGLCDAAAVVLFGSAVGAYIDRTPRLEAACRLYIVQNASLAACAATCLSLLWGSQAGMHVAIYWTLVVLTIITGSISSLGAMGASLSVEREWTKALCASDSEALAQTNAVMKRIDLTCLIASPIAVGVVMTWRLDAAVVAITLWNITAWAPECYLLQRAQRASPALTAPKHASGKEGASTPRRSMWERAGQVFAGWGAYCAQPVAVPAFALALLYLTVMSFGTLMTAYLKWEGISEAGLSVYRGLGALSGIFATVVFPPMQRSIGLVKTAGLAIWAQLACLALGATPALAAAFAGGSTTASGMHALVAGLILSRFGLWAFDLAVNQMIQETAEPEALGAVMGVQGSLQSLCQLLAYTAGVVVSQPERFPLLIAGSVGVVTMVALLFSSFAVRSRCAVPVRLVEVPPSP